MIYSPILFFFLVTFTSTLSLHFLSFSFCLHIFVYLFLFSFPSCLLLHPCLFHFWLPYLFLLLYFFFLFLLSNLSLCVPFYFNLPSFLFCLSLLYAQLSSQYHSSLHLSTFIQMEEFSMRWYPCSISRWFISTIIPPPSLDYINVDGEN